MTTPPRPLLTRFWADLCTTDFEALDPARTVAVLPVAATEQHGPHLPLRVDQAIADGMVAACLPHLGAEQSVLFLPTQAVGYSPEHGAFAGTLSLGYETVLRSWIGLGECVARAGVRKLLIFNSHGGQVSLMDIAARELRSRARLIVYSNSWYQLPLGAALQHFGPQEQRFGVHAGAVETALMLALAPQWVDMTAATDFKSTSQERAAAYPILGNGSSAKLGWQMQDYNPHGAAGNAAAATADQGRALLEAGGQQLAQLLREMGDLPLDTLRDRPGQ